MRNLSKQNGFLAKALDKLFSIWRVPLATRLRAAIEAAPYVHPKLSVAANFNVGFGSRLEQMAERKGIANVIDARSFQKVDVVKEAD